MFFNKMARGTKRKLAIFAGTSKCLIYAEAKFCASEMPGQIKYYECSPAEYCCAFGCCVSPGFHFPHLWYYWILVIIMFLVCSGGGWWYRYWLQGRYRAATSAIPNRSSNSRNQNPLRGTTCQAQRARITYNSARNTVLLHRMWKGPQRNGAAPAYNGSAATSAHYQNMSVVLNDASCPYYQLYGPPPSYETVIAQTRGKLSNPASPESSTARLNLQSPNVIPNPTVSQCFSYTCNPSTRLNNGLDQSTQYQNGASSPRQLDNHEAIPFTHFPQYCATNGTIRRNMCVPYEHREQPLVTEENFSRPYQNGSTSYVSYPMDKSSDTSDPESQSYELSKPERYTMISNDCAGSSREPNHWEPNDRSIPKNNGKADKSIGGRSDKDRGRRVTGTPEKVRMFFSVPETEEDTNSAQSEPRNFEEESQGVFPDGRRIYGGSLKSVGRYVDRTKSEEHSVQRVLLKSLPRSCEGIVNSEHGTENSSQEKLSSLKDTANASTSPLQSNPSSNVILDSFVPDEQAAPSGTAGPENGEHRPRLTNGSTNSDLESKHRLDRSKSLD